jgi:hypothetical protein
VAFVLLAGALCLATPPALAPAPRPAGLELRGSFVGAAVICVEGESLGPVLLEISLTNRSTETQSYLPLLDARKWGALTVQITQPDGSVLRAYGDPHELPPTDPFHEQLKPGKTTRTTLSLAWFGYQQPVQVGKHILGVSLYRRGGSLVSQPIEFEVVKIAPEAILASARIPLSETAAQDAVARRKSVLVEQIKVGDRVFLFYRRFSGTGDHRRLELVARVAELPGKVEMKVEGTYGDRQPLTVAFKDRRSKTGTTTILIDAADGTLRDGVVRDASQETPPEVAPAPRAIKP